MIIRKINRIPSLHRRLHHHHLVHCYLKVNIEYLSIDYEFFNFLHMHEVLNKSIIKLIHSTIMCNIISNIFNNSDKLSYKIFYHVFAKK